MLNVGARVYWRDDKNDLATVTEKDWAGVTLKLDNRSQQAVLEKIENALRADQAKLFKAE